MKIGSQYFIYFFPLVITAIGACASLTGVPQEKKYFSQDDPIYKKEFKVDPEAGEKIVRYGNHYVVSKVDPGFRVRVYNPDLKVLNEIESYSTPALSMRHGEYESYWDDGSIYRQGEYQYGKRHGIWVESEAGGGKSYSGEYINDKREGLWTQLDSNGIKEATYEYHDGLKHGKYYAYDADGKKVNEGLYRSDTLISELFKDVVLRDAVLVSCDQPNQNRSRACTETSLRQFFSSKVRYPPIAVKNEIEGEVVVQFDIQPDGTLANIRVPLSLSNDIEKELRDAMADLPAWKPATRNGVPYKTTYTLPLNFVR